LKTPLAIIQAESKLALRETLNEPARVHLTRLNGAVRQAAKGVQQLLSLSRLDNDSSESACSRRCVSTSSRAA